MSRVTAVIPCYNGERYLPRAIASIRAQTRPVDEVLVIDDRSTDRSREVAEAAGARVVVLERNSGPSSARNMGLQVATSELVAFLDADDEWTPSHCALVVGLLESAPQAVLGFGRSTYFEFPDVPSAASIPEGRAVDALAALVRENPVPQSAAVVRRDVALRLGGYDLNMRHSEDYDLWLRLAMEGPFVCTHQITCWRDAHIGQASRDQHAMRRGAWQARSRALARLTDSGDTRARGAAWEAAVAGWRDELRSAWQGESRRGLEATLAIRREYGLPAGPYWMGMLKRHVLWHPRQFARYVWRQVRRKRISPLLVTD